MNTPDEVHVGILRKWNLDRGYGFVRPIGGTPADDVFVLRSVLPDSACLEGARLRSAVEMGPRGPRVRGAALIDGP